MQTLLRANGLQKKIGNLASLYINVIFNLGFKFLMLWLINIFFICSMLMKLVKQHGVRKWSQIAKELVGRIGKQCRERWHNHLRPDIKVGSS